MLLAIPPWFKPPRPEAAMSADLTPFGGVANVQTAEARSASVAMQRSPVRMDGRSHGQSHRYLLFDAENTMNIERARGVGYGRLYSGISNIKTLFC